MQPTIENRATDPSDGSSRHHDTVQWLDDTEMQAWRSYCETMGGLISALEADLAPHDLTMGDYEVLVVLSDAEQSRMRMCDLAGQLRLSPSGMTRRLDGLVKAGYVRRTPSELDRRAMLAVLTDEGVEAMRRAAPDHVDSVRRHLLDCLSRQQIEAMADIFQTVRESLEGATMCPE